MPLQSHSGPIASSEKVRSGKALLQSVTVVVCGFVVGGGFFVHLFLTGIAAVLFAYNALDC